ncbi:MAG TPA: dTDP-4-dehydrorhamnose 3,5-epimerase [Gemmatimonadales bacterium]|nr:dTDP-4-dehydrorhamnose 3,5-epimerase [Gemmatimonadales bacterium]
MIFEPTPLAGAVTVELERHEDERGFFARSFCRREFEAQGLDPCVAQCNVSFNRRRGTLRGLHWQAAPHGEAKLVRVTRGELYDVIVDLRPDSPTLGRWFGVELTADNHRALYIPLGFAHGFQTLVDEVEVFYQMSTFYAPEAQRGARWDDPAFGIHWPILPPFLSQRDATYPDYDLGARP